MSPGSLIARPWGQQQQGTQQVQACFASCCTDLIADIGPGPRANAITDIKYGSKGQTEQQICSWMILIHEDTGAVMPSCSTDTDKLDRARKPNHTVEKPLFGILAAIPVSGIRNVRIRRSAINSPQVRNAFLLSPAVSGFTFPV